MIRNSLDSMRAKKKEPLITTSRTLVVTKKNSSKKNEFARLYQKQKTEYDKLLKKYGIEESVDDHEYHQFMNQ